ncbi:MAG: 16S rRNA (adenine(1518)-N(6)/adenine(1519)-N(6))-dimethyltransferase RsmA [Planctomycetota bacterium]
MREAQRGQAQPFDIAEAMATVRTKRDIEAIFRYFGLRASKRLGQNFLVDHNLLDLMVREAQVSARDLALDIGSGTGMLTAHLADAAGKVLGFEVDRRLFAIASRFLGDRANVALIQGDVLASKHALAPRLTEAVADEWRTGRYEGLKVVSNLPYSIASLVVPNLLESDLPVALMLVTVQREVAERLAAEPGRKAYGSPSVVVQAHAAVEIVRRVPPSVFWPRPKVDSAIVRVTPQPERLASLRDYDLFLALVRSAFAHRRKTLANALKGCEALTDKAAAEALLTRCGVEPTSRAESLRPGQFIALANALAQWSD